MCNWGKVNCGKPGEATRKGDELGCLGELNWGVPGKEHGICTCGELKLAQHNLTTCENVRQDGVFYEHLGRCSAVSGCGTHSIL